VTPLRAISRKQLEMLVSNNRQLLYLVCCEAVRSAILAIDSLASSSFFLQDMVKLQRVEDS